MAEQSDAIVFFGATGDLAYKKIFPALQSMIKHGELDVPVIGVAKAGWDQAKLRERAKASLTENGGLDPAAFDKLCSKMRYVDGDYRDSNTFKALARELNGARHPLHYLAIPPSLFDDVAEGLSSAGLNNGARIVLEKPFGRDLASAQELNQLLHRFFPEEAIYRIDHYLGKEAVQNIIYTRFANMLFEPIWNRNYIQSVQIHMAEKFGVDGRGKLYEELGAIRDVVQNHMLQLVSLLAMEPPAGSHGEALRDERAQVLHLVRSLTPADVVRGQFAGYRNEEGVSDSSNVETFAAVRMWVDSWRWAGVPFYIRVGKNLPSTCTEVLVNLKQPPQAVFPEGLPGRANFVRFGLSGEVIVSIGIRAKNPGEGMSGSPVELIAQQYPHTTLEPYERLLMEASRGENAFFARQDAVEEQWRIVNGVLDDSSPVHEYQPGTWGPAEADSLIAPEAWIEPCQKVNA